jgi:beta-phosphoglucomutase
MDDAGPRVDGLITDALPSYTQVMDAARSAAAVIFDMDGVLVDSAEAHRRAWTQLGDEVGTPFTTERFQQTFGMRNASIIPAWLGEVSPQRFAKLDQRKEALYRELVRKGAVRIYRRIPELFVELRRRGAGVAVASSGPGQNVALLIDTMGARGFIDVVIAAEDVSHGKPHPEAFLKAAERLQVAPRCCAVIEDSVHGIDAAKRAGMRAIAVLTSTSRDALVAAGADVVVNEVGDLQFDDLLVRLDEGVSIYSKQP